MTAQERRRLTLKVLAVLVLPAIVGVALGLWLSTLDTVGTCAPNAHPAVCVSRCADVQPACR